MKYRKDHIRRMAKVVIKSRGTTEYNLLMNEMFIRTRKSEVVVMNKLIDLAYR